MTDNADEWFSRYRFCQPLGQGGMGVIYLAQDRKNNNCQCIIKQLLSKHSDPEEHKEAIRFFKREAALLQSLNHPGIVRVFDHHATGDDKYFLVMDYVKGKNLEALVKNHGPFTSETAVEIAIQCCEVLEYLHGQEPPVIYRDMKPSNLMLTPEGQIVFIDFGIARTFIPKETATRVVTTGYSPPEQYFGKPETRSDLYALGATLSHLLTGKRPKPLSVSTPVHHNPAILLSLDDLVRRLTSHNPEDRPSSAQEVRYELYHIYHEIHPDFDIPEQAQQNKLFAHGQNTGLSLIKSRGTPQPINTKELQQYARKVEATRKERSGKYNRSQSSTRTGQGDKETRQRLWERFRSWLGISR